MEMFVTFRAFESINEPKAVQHLREQVGERMQRLQKSGNMVDARIFADGRGGYMLLDVDDGAHLQELLGGEILDHFRVESHPTVTFEGITRFFEEHPVAGGSAG